jgi:hypothetical protein
MGVSDVTVDELARVLNIGAGPANSGRLQAAITTAEDVVSTYCGRIGNADMPPSPPAVDPWPAPFPAGPHSAILGVAVRVYRSADVVFGVLQTDLGLSFTGRWITPEVDAALIGWRVSWGIA